MARGTTRVKRKSGSGSGLSSGRVKKRIKATSTRRNRAHANDQSEKFMQAALLSGAEMGLVDPRLLDEDPDELGSSILIHEHKTVGGESKKKKIITDRNAVEKARQELLPPILTKPAPGKEDRLSEGEQRYYARLVAKHGDNYLAMARDIKLNVYQHAPGMLKKKCELWKSKYEHGVPKGKGFALEEDEETGFVKNPRLGLRTKEQQFRAKDKRKR